MHASSHLGVLWAAGVGAEGTDWESVMQRGGARALWGGPDQGNQQQQQQHSGMAGGVHANGGCNECEGHQDGGCNVRRHSSTDGNCGGRARFVVQGTRVMEQQARAHAAAGARVHEVQPLTGGGGGMSVSEICVA
jgi:hypothetical protein